MIIGIGTDIIEIDRVEKAVKSNSSFLNKLFTDKEIELFKKRNMKYETIAGNFAAKEAISKAIGTGFRGFSLKDIEVLRDQLGKPTVFLSEAVTAKLTNSNVSINLSIAHNKNNAIAFAIIEEKI